MEYATLRGTGLAVSKLCLGAMTFGDQVSEADAVGIIRYAMDNGINFIDTADVYVGGTNEIVVGKGISGHRDEMVLATKVGNVWETDNPNERGLSRRHITNALERSLKYLNTDYIDIYYMHVPDRRTPWEETLDTLSGLVRSGKVRYIGISNHAAWQIMETQWICDKRSFVRPVVTQNVYNLITRGIEEELLPCIRKHDIGFLVYNPLAGGMLTGKHKRGKPEASTRFSLKKNYYERYWSDENFDAVEKLTAIAAKNGLSLPELAMKWCISQPQVDCVITGVTNLDHFKQNVLSIEGERLSGDILKDCDEIWNRLKGTRFRYFR